jgi:hypothetical protein
LAAGQGRVSDWVPITAPAPAPPPPGACKTPQKRRRRCGELEDGRAKCVHSAGHASAWVQWPGCQGSTATTPRTPALRTCAPRRAARRAVLCTEAAARKPPLSCWSELTASSRQAGRAPPQLQSPRAWDAGKAGVRSHRVPVCRGARRPLARAPPRLALTNRPRGARAAAENRHVWVCEGVSIAIFVTHSQRPCHSHRLSAWWRAPTQAPEHAADSSSNLFLPKHIHTHAPHVHTHGHARGESN